jgi:HlyD family secretion protein
MNRNRSRTVALGFVVLGLAVATTPGCSKSVTLKAVQVASVAVESTVTTISSGTVDAQQQAVLGFSAAGRVKRISVRLGDTVKPGALIAQLDNTDLQAVHDEAVRERDRAKQLFDSGLVSRVALDEAAKNYEIARANLDKTVIRAPFEGVVTELNLEAGELYQGGAGATNVGKASVRIVDLKPRIVKGQIDEADIAKVKAGAAARIKILAVRAKPFAARVERVVPYVSTTREQDRTSEIELRITEAPEGPALIPVGASADIEIVVASKENVPALPSRTVLGLGANRYVYRVDGNRIRRTPIQVGLGNYDRTEIVSGVAAGDAVVFPSDEIELKDGIKVQTEKVAWP